jgi:hypothetical protein
MRFLLSRVLAVAFGLAVTAGMSQLASAQSGAGSSAPTGSPSLSAPTGSPGTPGTASQNGLYSNPSQSPTGANYAGSSGASGKNYTQNSSDDLLTREQHILDGKLNSICRGC